MTQSLQGQLSK